MGNTQKHLVEEGTSIDPFIITETICCPSRASILRGQYPHNTTILTNDPPYGGFATFYQQNLEESTLATWLDQAGYDTALFGKYLNNYPGGAPEDYIPPGWNTWYSPTSGDYYRGYDYTLNENGKLVDYRDQPEDYLTDVLAERVITYLHGRQGSAEPFFIFLTPFVPHPPAPVAERHQGLFSEAQIPRTPGFNETDISDKPRHLQYGILNDEQVDQFDREYRKRLRSVQAVDEMIGKIFSTLESTGQLDETYIFFTSDNGYHMGHHRLYPGKGSAYEEDIRVPFIVRGPGIDKSRLMQDYLVGNIDIAPTLADFAGVIPPDFVDGLSFKPILLGLDNPTEWREGLLIEYYEDRSQTRGSDQPGWIQSLRKIIQPQLKPLYRALRNQQYTYILHQNGAEELYDLQTDPHQLENIIREAEKETIQHLRKWMDHLSKCQGETCRSSDREIK
jgi:arylsulfatase A-like enzyme